LNIGNVNSENDSVLYETTSNDIDDLFQSMNASEKANYLFQSAIQLYEMNDYRAAINNLNIAMQFDKTNPDYYYYRGVIFYEGFNNLDSAIIDMNKVIKLNSDYWRACQNRAFYNYLKNNNIKALQDINTVGHTPKSAHVCFTPSIIPVLDPMHK